MITVFSVFDIQRRNGWIPPIASFDSWRAVVASSRFCLEGLENISGSKESLRQMVGGLIPNIPAQNAPSKNMGEVALVDALWTAFILRFSNQWPLNVHESPIHAHVHTPTAESAMLVDSQLVGSSEG